MREIKFRGMPIENYGDTKWLYGSAIIGYEDKLAYIEANYQGCIPVKWGTVSQYTGLKDSKGNEIYEGDIVSTDLSRPFLIVEFRNGAFMYQCHDNGQDYYDHMEPAFSVSVELTKYHKIIGNIYENQEILKGDEK
ncbi:YopX family protein [Bacillus sp. FSL R12-0074]|uniref:YopX family protein n=1 Tax=Bacillus sp. FSL R12-0074 TaxID=2954664 RepID=UPI0030FB5AFC